jgi:hypothetical protein
MQKSGSGFFSPEPLLQLSQNYCGRGGGVPLSGFFFPPSGCRWVRSVVAGAPPRGCPPGG